MTIMAFLAVKTFVFVFELVAIHTLGAEVLVVDILALVTLPAGDLDMSAFEFEIGILVMIKFDTVPSLLPMTVVTFPAVLTLMFVVAAVTGITFHRNTFVTLIDMAILAIDADMLSFQGKVGL